MIKISSLGSISVTFTANAAGFTKAIRAATQHLSSFGNAARLASAASAPFQSTFGSMGSVVAGTTANLGRLSASTVESTSRMNMLQAAAVRGQTSLTSFGANLGNVATNLGGVASKGAEAAKVQDDMIKLTQRAGESTGAFTARVDAQTKTLQKQVPMGHQIQSSYRMMGDASLQASHRIVKANNQSIMSMINFRDFAAKIVHYLTFTIGVQMVMGITRGIKALIDTMTDFQKECVRTAGVAGRLGGAFDKTVQDIAAVSMELGKNTIFKASEAAHAMYDLASAGFDVANAVSTVTDGMKMIGPILDYAAAQQIELAESTAAVSRALKMFGMDLSDSEYVVDTFTAAIANSFLTADKLRDALRYSGAMAHTLGISLRETVASAMALSDAGLTGAQSGQRLNMIMTKLLKPTDKAKRTLAALGLTIEDITPETHTLAEIFQTLEQAGFGAGEAANFFRARTAGAAAALIRSADEMERYKQTLLGAEGITRELADRQEKTLWGSFKLLSAAVESLALKFGEFLMPAIQGLVDFAKTSLLPILEVVISAIKFFGSILAPIVPFLKYFAAGLVSVAMALGIIKIAMWLAAKATAIWNGTLMANPIIQIIVIVGILAGALIGLADAFGILTPIMEAVGGFVNAVSDYVKGLGERLFDTNNQARKSHEYYKKLDDTVDKYGKSLDILIHRYDKQLDAQKAVDDLLQNETISIEKLSLAKAKAAKAAEAVIGAEDEFYKASALLMKGIARLTEGLDIYVEALGKVGVAQDKIAASAEDQKEIEEDLVKLNQDLVDAVNRYGEGSQEVLNIETDLYKKHKELLDVGEELVDLDVKASEEVKKRRAEYNKLSKAEKAIADIGKDLLANEKLKKDTEIKMTKLLAKKNVLLSTRNNFERYFNERIDLLRDAEQKLYDIELKIYKLRHGVVDTYRDLFKALTQEGVVTDELIATYKDMEVAEGNSLKEHVEYVRILDGLNESSRRSVTEWTKAYVDALDEGMSQDEARIKANGKMGMSLKDISKLNDEGIKGILEYAHAEHIAYDAKNSYRVIAMGLANDMVDSGQASVELAAAFYLVKNNVNDLEKEEANLIKANENMDKSMLGLIRTVGLLHQYWLEFGGVGEDINAITIGMVNNMGLVESVGADQLSILKRLNSFYNENRASLEDYDAAMIISALSAIKWAEFNEGFEPKTITADQIVAELPVDDFTEFIALAMSGMNTLEGEFDGVASSINGMTKEIHDLVEEIRDLIELQFPEIPEPPKSAWDTIVDKANEIWRNVWKLPEGAKFEWSGSSIRPTAKGLITAARGISRTNGPTNALIGENGAEAVVPLEGHNRRFGRDILKEIIPKYYPDLVDNRLHMQRGGLVNTTRASIPISTSKVEKTEIVVHGDIIVQNPANYDEFYDELIRRLGKSKRLVP